jgi:hypothetical protein
MCLFEVVTKWADRFEISEPCNYDWAVHLAAANSVEGVSTASVRPHRKPKPEPPPPARQD